MAITKWIAFFLMTLTMLFFNATFADENNNATITITVPVADHSEIALKAGLQDAFYQALLEMSNDVQITSQPVIKTATLHVKQWIQSYSYLDAQSTATPAGVAPTLSLQVIFYQDELQKLIQQAQNPTNHPLTETDAQISLYIAGVRNISDYSQVVQALKSNKTVKTVAVKNMDASNVLLEVTIASNANDLARDLSQNNHFTVMRDDRKTQLSAADLYYRWAQDVPNQTISQPAVS